MSARQARVRSPGGRTLRLLKLVALTVGGWALLVIVADAARADDGSVVSCVATAVGAVDPAVSGLPSDGVLPLVSESTGAAEDAVHCENPAPPDPPAPTDVPAPPDIAVPPAIEPVPPPPAPVDVPVIEVPPVIPEQLTPPEPAPVPQPAVDPTSAAAAAELAAVEPVVADAVVAKAVDAALLDTAPVSQAEPVLTEAVLCPAVEPAGLDGVPFTGPPVSAVGREFAPHATATATGAIASPAPTGRNSPPGSPASPLAPINLPMPLPAPAGPPCPSAGTSAGASACGSGHDQFADGTYAVLETRFAAATHARGTVRPTSGFAGDIVGGADDPGTRPG